MKIKLADQSFILFYKVIHTIMYQYGFYIGRFQPFHNGHLKMVQEALKQVNHLIIFIGSSSNERTLKNPFIASERQEMIHGCLSDDDKKRVSYVFIEDCPDDNVWFAVIRENISKITESCKDKQIALIGYEKDASSYYLKNFEQYSNLMIKESYFENLSSTPIRNLYFDKATVNISQLPYYVSEFMDDFLQTEHYQELSSIYKCA